MFDCWRAFWAVIWIYVVAMTWLMIDRSQISSEVDVVVTTSTNTNPETSVSITQRWWAPTRKLPNNGNGNGNDSAEQQLHQIGGGVGGGGDTTSQRNDVKRIDANIVSLKEKQQLKPTNNNVDNVGGATSAPHDNDNDNVDVVDVVDDADFSRLIDLENFAYRIEQPPCSTAVQALILVHTAPRNTEKRALIRETWGGEFMKQTPMRLLFLLGDVGAEPELEAALDKEAALHNDMVQGTFHDDYRNLTYKHVMALKWLRYNCENAQILIKVDDDVFVNSPLLLKQMSLAKNAVNNNLNTSEMKLAQLLFQAPKDLLFCHKFVGSRVRRSYRSKWRVKLAEFPYRYYPPYCPGYAIIYSSDVAVRLYEAAQKANYFWIDDVQITGIMAERTNTNITTLEPYLLHQAYISTLLTLNNLEDIDNDNDIDDDDNNGTNDKQRALLNQPYLFAGDNLPAKKLRELWKFYSSLYPIPQDGGIPIQQRNRSTPTLR